MIRKATDFDASAGAPTKCPQTRLFLSYGRKDGKDLADRLRHDLEKIYGYEVWQDTMQIRSGVAWEQQLKDGLRSSQLVVALLSPHAVRVSTDPNSPDNQDSVCLDELSFARFSDPTKPIIPAMAQPCEPPFSIFRLDYVDLCQWRESETQYQSGLTKLVACIKNALSGKVLYREWDSLLSSCDFARFLNDKRKDFCGRQWLFDEIDSWRLNANERTLLIKGAPGTGKSALVAELVHSNPGGQILAYHCCRSSSDETLDPARFVRSIAAMVASKFVSYSEMLKKPELVHALSEENCKKSPISAFETGILTPLEYLHAPDDGSVRYILIDALDEALLWGRACREATIVDILQAHSENFPAWIRVVATTRPAQDILSRFSGLRAKEISARSRQNEEDIKLFLHLKLNNSALAIALEKANVRPENALESLCNKSNGNFLYAKQAIQDIERGIYQIGGLNSLPPSLNGLYEEYLSRLFPDRSKGFATVRKLLEILLTSYTPLSLEELALLSGLDTEEELSPALRQLSSYIQQQEGRYEIYHKSFSDWLTTPENSGAWFHISRASGAKQIASVGWKRYVHTCEKLTKYFIQYLPRHLASLHMDEKLKTLLIDYRYLKAKIVCLPPYTLVQDYDMLGLDRSSPLGLIQGAITLASETLVTHPDQLASQLYGRLVGDESPEIQSLLESIEAHETNWLKPVTRCFTSPGGPVVRTIITPNDTVVKTALSGDGSIFISGSFNGLIQCWNLYSGECLRTIAAHSEEITALSLLSENRYLATASGSQFSDNGAILKIWDLSTNLCLHAISAHDDTVTAIISHPDKAMVISVSEDGSLKTWDWKTGVLISAQKGHKEKINTVDLNLLDGQIISASDDGTIKVWDIENLRCLKTLGGHEGAVTSVALHPSGKALISASEDNTVRVWNLKTGECAHSFVGHSGWVNSVLLHSSGRYVFSASKDRTIKVWDLKNKRCVHTLAGHSSDVHSILFGALNDSLISCSGELHSKNQEIRIWDLGKATCEALFLGHIDAIYSLLLHPDRNQLISSSADHTIRLWDLEARPPIATRNSHSGRVNSVAIVPASALALSAGKDGVLMLWNTHSGTHIRSLQSTIGPINHVSTNPEGTLVIVAAGTGEKSGNGIEVWDIQSGVCMCKIMGHEDTINAALLHPDGLRAITASGSWQAFDNSIKVWDIESGNCLNTLLGHKDAVMTIALHPDGKRLFSGSGDMTIRVWDIGTGKCLQILEGHAHKINNVPITPDGKTLFSASNDGTIKKWDIITRTCTTTLPGHTVSARSISQLSNAGTLASIGDDCFLKIWDSGEMRTIASVISERHSNWSAVDITNDTIAAGHTSGEISFFTLCRGHR